MRVVAHAAILWVGCLFCFLFFMPVPEPGRFEVLGGSRASVGQVLVPFGRVYRPFWRRHLWGDSVVWSWLPGHVVGRWLQWSARWSRGARGRRCRIGFVWRTGSRIFHVLETAGTLRRASQWAQDVGVDVHFVVGVTSVFRGGVLVWILGALVITSLIFMSEVCDELSVFYAVVRSWACCVCLHHVLCNRGNER